MDRVIKRIEKVFAFRVPPTRNSGGYKAKEWGAHVWAGSMSIEETKAAGIKINLVEETTGKIFASCPVRVTGPTPVERALDSMRYFVLRIEHPETKQCVFIGIGFIDRGSAFDFQTAVNDSRESLKVEKSGKPVDWGPDKDFSLKAGQTMNISMPGAIPKKASNATSLSGGGIAPPPSATGSRRRRRRGRQTEEPEAATPPAAPTASAEDASAEDDWVF